MPKTWDTPAMSGDTKIVGLWRDKHKTGEAAALPTQRADLGVNSATEDMMSADDEPFEGASPTSKMIRGGAIAAALIWLAFYGWFLFGAGFTARKSVVMGKSVSVRGDLGGLRNIKQKQQL